MRPRRGSGILRGGGINDGLSGTRLPNPTHGTYVECDSDGNERKSGGVSGAHENRREHGAETLPALCWCQADTVDVPTEVIRRAETLSCGHPECRKETC